MDQNLGSGFHMPIGCIPHAAPRVELQLAHLQGMRSERLGIRPAKLAEAAAEEHSVELVEQQGLAEKLQ